MPIPGSPLIGRIRILSGGGFPFLHMEICLLGLCLQHGRGNLAVLWLPCPFQCQVDAKWSDIWVVDVDTVRYRLRLAVGSCEGGSCG